MELKPLIIGDLNIPYPIIQGGMGVGVSLSSLAGAVAKEGGAGIISTAQIGYRERDFDKNPLQANLRAIGNEIKRARQIAPNGIIGVNIMVATKKYGLYVQEAVKNGIDMIISGAGLPLELPALVKGADTKLVPIISSAKAANIILKMWEKKHHALPDAFVIEGPKAGGHLGFHKEVLDHMEDKDYEDEIRKIIALVKEWEVKTKKAIPVILAGGIRTRLEVERAIELGAEGVQAATRFVTTIECDAHENFKMAYVNCKKEDIVITQSPVGMPGRAIWNPFLKKIKEGRIPTKHCHQCLERCNPFETPYCITDALINAVKGDVDNALLFCGAEAYKENRINTVHEVMRQLTQF